MESTLIPEAFFTHPNLICLRRTAVRSRTAVRLYRLRGFYEGPIPLPDDDIAANLGLSLRRWLEIKTEWLERDCLVETGDGLDYTEMALGYSMTKDAIRVREARKKNGHFPNKSANKTGVMFAESFGENATVEAPSGVALVNTSRAQPAGTGRPDSGPAGVFEDSGTGRESGPAGRGAEPNTPLRMEPPLSVPEAFQALGMSQKKARERLDEFGAARCRDALESLAIKHPPPHDPAGWIVDFLRNRREVPDALKKAREFAQQRPMLLPVESTGPPGSPARTHSEHDAEQPCEHPPPKAMLQTVREKLGSIGRSLPEGEEEAMA